MYDSIEDHYCYKGTTVLKNRQNLRTQQALDRFELAITAQRATEALPLGKLNETRSIFSDSPLYFTPWP